MTPLVKAVVIPVILVAAAFLGLATPWYEVTNSQTLAQTMTNVTASINSTATTNTTMLTEYDTKTIYGQPQPVFTLNTTVILNGSCGASCWMSPNFQLLSGEVVQITAPDCQYCLAGIEDTNGSYNAAILMLPPPHNGIGTYTATATVTDSGTYIAILGNLGTAPISISTLSVAQLVNSLQVSSETSALVRANTMFTTINATVYSPLNSTTYIESKNPPYIVIGWAPSAAIILTVAILSAFGIRRRLD